MKYGQKRGRTRGAVRQQKGTTKGQMCWDHNMLSVIYAVGRFLIKIGLDYKLAFLLHRTVLSTC